MLVRRGPHGRPTSLRRPSVVLSERGRRRSGDAGCGLKARLARSTTDLLTGRTSRTKSRWSSCQNCSRQYRPRKERPMPERWTEWTRHAAAAVEAAATAVVLPSTAARAGEQPIEPEVPPAAVPSGPSSTAERLAVLRQAAAAARDPVCEWGAALAVPRKPREEAVNGRPIPLNLQM